MKESAQPALWILAAGGLLGLLGDGLLQEGPTGISMPLWIGAVVGALLWLSRRTARPLTPASRYLACGAAVVSLAFAWRDSPALLALDILAMAVLLFLAAAYGQGGSPVRSGLLDYVARMGLAGIRGAIAPLELFFVDVDWKSLPRGPLSGKFGAVLRGVLIALPLLLVFGVLFRSADAVFANLSASLWSFNTEEWAEHIIPIVFLSCLAAGFLRTSLLLPFPDTSTALKPGRFSLGAIELGTVLGLLNALFLTFVAIQFRYFFGGAALVEATTGMTYAEYARSGFFELVAVVALVLPLLLLAHWLLPAEAPQTERMYRWLSGALVVQLAVIMASALQRMMLYVGEYGLTELRLYSTAFMGWMALLLVWLCLTVLRGQRDRFAFGVLVSGLAMLAVLHLLNPDALIARTNLARLAAGQRFDVSYTANLSADAAPVLVDHFLGLEGEDRRILRESLEARFNPPVGGGDWRTWNLARSRAYQAVTRLADLP